MRGCGEDSKNKLDTQMYLTYYADRLRFELRPYKLTVYCTTIMLSVQIKEGIIKIGVYI